MRWLCVILSGFHCSKSRFTPLQAGEMGFLPQPRVLALKLDGCFPIQKSELGGGFFGSAFDPAELLFSHLEIRVGFSGDQHLIQLNCKGHHRAWSLQSTLEISLVPQGTACVHEISGFSQAVTIPPILCCHLRKYTFMGSNWSDR